MIDSMHKNCGFLISMLITMISMPTTCARTEHEIRRRTSCRHDNLIRQATLCCSSPAHSAEREKVMQ